MMSAPCGMVAGPLMSSAENLELPPAGGLCWTETDLNEKIINDGVEAKRFKVRAWSRREKRWREDRERERGTGKMVGTDQADALKVMREEMAELSLRVERLERAASWGGSGGSSGSGGNEWVWWNGTWWIRTKSRMNSANKRKVSRAVKQAMRQDDEN